jgi:membrane protein insertase Oxa1/YidC/SpoIIIJ
VYLIELVYSLFWRFTGVPGIAIIGVSLAVNLFCLPLYRMADDVQERERQKQASMARWVNHIKKHFSGDEQYMMLSAYYTEQNYRPIQALVGSISLLLQIPFFMAA